MVNCRIFAQRHYQVMEIRFSQARDEIDTGLFKRIDDFRRHFSFHVTFLLQFQTFIAKTKPAVKQIEPGGWCDLALCLPFNHFDSA